ncbi:MAG: hypothetical protein KIT84_06335 [Labilithrix sp.]|nr:hypothetical protein [Labilithrix sp.]MCW5810610.1 hypothetical protein [Labilithrix sp.]
MLVDRGGIVATAPNGDLYAWAFDRPDDPKKDAAGGPVLALRPDGKQIVVGGRGVTLADRETLAAQRELLAVSYSDAAVSAPPDGSLPSIFGDRQEASGLLRCAIGDKTFPFSLCAGRFVD